MRNQCAYKEITRDKNCTIRYAYNTNNIVTYSSHDLFRVDFTYTYINYIYVYMIKYNMIIKLCCDNVVIKHT